MKNSNPYINEEIIRFAAECLRDKIDSEVKKYFPHHQQEPIQNDKPENSKYHFISERYTDQISIKTDNEKDKFISERNKIEEMINYGKDEKGY